MASKFCCAAPQRSDSPDLPNARVTQKAGTASPEIHTAIGSTATSSRTEDREEIRRLFHTAVEAVDEIADLRCRIGSAEEEEPARKDITESPGVIGKLRKRLSKSGTKSLALLRSDANPPAMSKLRKLPDRIPMPSKEGLRKESLTDDRHASGGYDSDAKSVVIGESLPSTSQDDCIHLQAGGRKIPRRSPLQDIEWRARSLTS
jgi:hypothetical protein